MSSVVYSFRVKRVFDCFNPPHFHIWSTKNVTHAMHLPQRWDGYFIFLIPVTSTFTAHDVASSIFPIMLGGYFFDTRHPPLIDTFGIKELPRVWIFEHKSNSESQTCWVFDFLLTAVMYQNRVFDLLITFIINFDTQCSIRLGVIF
jgi:hypothetical protein